VTHQRNGSNPTSILGPTMNNLLHSSSNKQTESAALSSLAASQLMDNSSGVSKVKKKVS